MLLNLSRMIWMLKIVFICILIDSTVVRAADVVTCPLGAKEDQLTLARVMRNFGRFFSKAESLSIRGAQDSSLVSEKEMDQAISDLDIVVACAQSVLKTQTGDLLPSRVGDLSGSEREKYISQFIGFMSDFENQILNFKKILLEQRKISAENRDFRQAHFISQQLNDLINKAHDQL